jgi:hypothetical protein
VKIDTRLLGRADSGTRPAAASNALVIAAVIDFGGIGGQYGPKHLEPWS